MVPWRVIFLFLCRTIKRARGGRRLIPYLLATWKGRRQARERADKKERDSTGTP